MSAPPPAGKLGRRLAASLLLAGAAACSWSGAPAWALADIRGHLPNLQFHLTARGARPVTARDFRGKVVLLYFGYTHCPDTCPMTLMRLATELKTLGPEARNIDLLFVSVDPSRDTPEATDRYARAFSAAAVGLTGTPGEIEALARRYRVAYEAEAPDRDGNYEVMHSKGVLVFDRQGRARLLIGDTDSARAVLHDLRQLVEAPT